MAAYWSGYGLKDMADVAVGSADLRMLIVDTAPANAAAAFDLQFVSAVSGNEIGAASYSRTTLTGETTSIDTTNDEVLLQADDPGSQGNLESGDTIVGLWIFRQVTNDSDSILWCFLGLTSTPTNGGEITIAFGTATGGSKAISTLS